MEALKSFFAKAGFVAYPQGTADDPVCRKVLFQRPMEVRDDRTGYGATLHLNVTTFEYPGRPPGFESCEVDVTGEMPDGTWMRLLAYSIDPDQLPYKLDTIAARLRAAWAAAVAVEASST